MKGVDFLPKIYTELKIDFRAAPKAIITAIQGDVNSRYLDVTLVDKNIPVNLTDCTVTIFIKRPPASSSCFKKNRREFLYNIGQITDAENGRVQFPLTTEILEVPGYLECEISVEKIIKEKSEILTTPKFKILVSSTLKNKELLESTNEYGALVLAFENFTEASRFITSVVDGIGIPGEISQENNIETLFQGLEKIIEYVKNGGSSTDFSQLVNQINEKIIENTNAQTIALNAKIENSTNEILQKIGELPTSRRINSR